MTAARKGVYDWIRVLSLLGILLCHSCFEWRGCEGMGCYFAQMCNLIFLLLSSLLLGISWRSKNCPVYGKEFLLHHIRRLAKSFYLFIIIAIFYCHISGIEISPWRVVAQFAFLSWFVPMKVFGHLWYVTMIVLCYILVTLISQKNISKRLNISCNGNHTIVISLIAIVLISVSTLRGFPGAIFMYLWLYMMVFCNANLILDKIRKHSIYFWATIFLAVHIPAIYLYMHGLFSIRLASYFVSILTSSTMFALLYMLLLRSRVIKIVKFLSVISFEMYLTHNLFLGKYSVYNYTDKLFGFILLVSLTIVSGYLLHLISDWIFTKKRKYL